MSTHDQAYQSLPTIPPRVGVDPATALAIAVAGQAASGWRVEVQTPWQAVLANPNHVNHILHLLVSVFTGGLWLPFWLLIALTSRPSTITLTAYSDGSVGRTFTKA